MYEINSSKFRGSGDFWNRLGYFILFLLEMVVKSTRYRSAITGRYVSERYARSHPKTTVRETDKKK